MWSFLKASQLLWRQQTCYIFPGNHSINIQIKNYVELEASIILKSMIVCKTQNLDVIALGRTIVHI